MLSVLLASGGAASNNYIQIVVASALLIAAAAGVVGYFKANVSKSTIELYKDDNEALRTRLTTMEAELHEATTKINALENANHFLASVVTQADAIARLQASVDRILSKVGA